MSLFSPSINFLSVSCQIIWDLIWFSWVSRSCVAIMCRNDELSSTMSWVGCLLKDSKLFILFAENSQILLKISVIPILLTFIYLVALNLLVNNHLNSSSKSTHHSGTWLSHINNMKSLKVRESPKIIMSYKRGILV